MKIGDRFRFGLLVQSLGSKSWLPSVVAWVGAVVFWIRIKYFALTQASVLDEGLYLFKGLLYARGEFRPYQDYGFFVHQMLLADLIPGYLQLWFGPGLRIGRFFAVLFALILLFSMWITARRLGGRWIAALLVWAVALNTAPLKIYSQAISQGLTACMLMGAVALVLGRKNWDISVVCGVFLAGLIPVTRLDLLPVLPLILVYVFWQYGRSAGILSLPIGLIPFLSVHAYYWPEILKLYAAWLPESLTPFLNPWRGPADLLPVWGAYIGFLPTLESISFTTSAYFMAILGMTASWLFWPQRWAWQSETHYKASVFLSSVLLVQIAVHLIFFAGRVSVFGFPMYFAFYYGLSLLLAATSLRSWHDQSSPLAQNAVLFALALLLVLTFQDWLQPVALAILNFPLPRMSSGQLLPGKAGFWRILANKFGFSYEFQWIAWYFVILPILFFVILYGLLLLYLRFARRRSISNPLYRLFLGVLIGGVLLSPSRTLGGQFQNYDCGGNVIASVEKAGAYLATILPPQAEIYWAVYSPTPLLYVPALQIYPPQFDRLFNYTLAGDPDEVYKYGWWSEELARRWLKEADFVLIEEKEYTGWIKDELESGGFDELPPSPPVIECRVESRKYEDSRIYIFKRID